MAVPTGRRREQGAALVEFAFIVPILSIFLFGIVQFGLAYDMKQSINSAAREGARLAAIPDETNVTYTVIRNRVNSTFVGAGTGSVDAVTVRVVDAVTPATVLNTCTTSGCTSSPPRSSPCSNHPGQTVVVTATENFDLTIPFLGVRPITLTGKGEFRCEIDA